MPDLPTVPDTTTSVPATLLKKPGNGETLVVDVNNEQKIAFDFNLDDVKLELRDVDLVVTFTDGSSIVLVGFGLRMVDENIADLTFNGLPISNQSLLSLVGTFIASDVADNNMSTSSPQNTVVPKEDAEKKPAQAPPPEIIEVQAEPNKHKADYEKKAEKSNSDMTSNETRQDAPMIVKKQYDEPPAAASPSVFNDNTSKKTGDGKYNIPVPDVTAKLFGIVDSETSDSNSVHRIEGALGLAPADKDTAYSAQSQVDTINGTDNQDLIYADDPTYAGVGTTTRSVELTTVMPDPKWEIQGLKVIGLPPGYSIVGAQQVNGNYIIPIDPSKSGLSNIKLQYVLPVDGSAEDANGFFSFFTLKLEFKVRNDSINVTGTTVGSVAFGIRDVQNADDTQYVDPVTKTPIYVLWSRPPGTVVNAGEGNDTVIAGAGFDVLSGGRGTDLLSYRQSSSAVSVDLATNTVSGGYAEGDRISEFESVEGSGKNDRLTGNALDNTLIGGAGADRLDGADGFDTADYHESSAAVTIDLNTGTGIGGDAQGDTLLSIERVVGSNYNDVLKAGVTSATLEGGLGNDTLYSGASADILSGGDGNDTVAYSQSNAGVTVDLNRSGAQVSGGAADGDLLTSIENVTGSAFNDVLTGNSGVNILYGGAGNDLLDGGDGADKLYGDAGSDTVSYAQSSAGVAVNLTAGTGSGGSAEGDTLYDVENLVGSDFNDRLTGNASANSLSGGAMDDVLAGLGGADALDGGTGTNTADYSLSTAGVSVNISSSAYTNGSGTQQFSPEQAAVAMPRATRSPTLPS